MNEPKIKSTAYRLVKDDDPHGKPVAWYCGQCGRVYKDQHDAERCGSCAIWECQRCGDKCAAFQKYCSSCRHDIRLGGEVEKLENAEKIPASKYPDDQGVVWQDEYYSSIDILLDHCELEEIEPPKLVWATAPERFKLDADEWVDYRLEEWLEGADENFDFDSVKGRASLRAAIREFNDANSHLVLYFETNKAVVLEREDNGTEGD